MDIYVIIVGILFLLAISNLIVGVSNDAVNFLVSAIGSKAGKFNVIMIMAGIGILIGATFSNGMMEVARKGIFHPELFYFNEIIMIFMAVMLTDVILLDFFNTFGFPTSTTVSLVFSLLGSAIAIAIAKSGSSGLPVSTYINSGSALTIIGGILLSVVVAFITGLFVQSIARIIFSFNYEKSFKYFGGLWGGFAFSIITYFMFIKGFKSSTLANTEIIQWIIKHQIEVILLSFVIWTIIFQILISFFRVNVLKIIVLVGTMALAMAFAGNDLVNFIGVPLAGFSSFEFWHNSGVAADKFLMVDLIGKVHVNILFLIVSALIMIITLWVSKKARTVTQTEINLSRQDAGYERFGSTQLSRALVRWSIGFSEIFKKIIPAKSQVWIEKRFDFTKSNSQKENSSAYDLIRASVNLVVASILIAIATSFKLPLSTTYVTFMVAMGTSLADRAWGRESAVFRVTGVLSVISGWFFTAFVAFAIAFTIAIIIHFGGILAIGLFVALDVFLIYHSRIIHKQRMKKEQDEIKKYKDEIEISKQDMLEVNTKKILSEIDNSILFISNLQSAFISSKRKELKKAVKLANEIKSNVKYLKKNIFTTVQNLNDENLKAAQYYVQVIDSLREISNAITFLAERYFEHIDNNHDIFKKKQLKDLNVLQDKLHNFMLECKTVIEKNKYVRIDELREIKNQFLIEIEEVKTKQLRLIHDKEVDLINSNLYLNVLAEYKNIALYFIRLVKSQKRFYISSKLAKKNKN